MRKEDLEDIVNAEKGIFSSPFDEETFSKHIDDDHCICITAVNKSYICGYIAILCSQYEGDLLKVAVKEAFRGRGIGRELVKAGFRECRNRGVESIFLEVRQSNTHAIEMYEQIGFEHISDRQGYYDNPREDAMIMKCTIK